VAFVVLVATAPILGWIYSPDAFGDLAYFMFVFQMLGSICVCRFDWLMPNARLTTEELGLMVLGVICLIGISLISVLVFYFPPALISNWEGYKALGAMLTLVSLAVSGMGIRLLLTATFVRSGDLSPVSRVKVLETLCNAGASIALGLAGFVVNGLIIARVISSWVGVFHLLSRTPINRNQIRRVRLSRLNHIFHRHWWSATRSTLVSFTNTLSTNAPILVLGVVAGTTELGLFFMATRLISTPIQLGAKALSQSFWSRSAELARTKQFQILRQEYLSLLLRLLIIAIGFVLILVGVGLVVEYFFPPQWNGLSPTFLAFTPMVLGVITIGSTNHLIIFDKPQYQLVADATRLISMVLSVFALANMGAPFWAIVLAVSLSSLAGHAVLFVMHLYAYHQTTNHQPLDHGRA